MTTQFRFPCPFCGEALMARRDHAGKKAKCTRCGTMMTVPKFLPNTVDPDWYDEAPPPPGWAAPMPPTPAAPPAPARGGPPPAAGPWEPRPLPPWFWPAVGIGGAIVALVLAVVLVLLVLSSKPTRPDTPMASPPPATQPVGVTSPPMAIPRTPAPNRPAPAPAPAVAGGTLTTKQVVQRAIPSICLIRGPMGFGTGFLVRPGIVATNAHVIAEEFADDLEATFDAAPTGQRGPVRLSVLHVDFKRDLALLRAATTLPPLPLATDYSHSLGDRVIVIGNPAGPDRKPLLNTPSEGPMGQLKRFDDGRDFYLLSMAVNGGNSGGPAFDETGRVIGVVAMKSRVEAGLEAQAFAIPVTAVVRALGLAEHQTEEQTRKVAARFRAQSAFQLLNSCADLYSRGLESFTAGIEEAVRRGLPAQTGYDAAAKVLQEKVGTFNQVIQTKLKPHLTKVFQDGELEPAEVRADLLELYRTYQDLKEQFDTFNGTVDEFKRKAREKANRFQRLSERLKLLLDL